MIKCRRRQATDPQKFKNCQQSFSRFLSVEAEAEPIGVEAEAVDKISDSTSLIVSIWLPLSFCQKK